MPVRIEGPLDRTHHRQLHATCVAFQLAHLELADACSALKLPPCSATMSCIARRMTGSRAAIDAAATFAGN
jgi:hypothetical protein